MKLVLNRTGFLALRDDRNDICGDVEFDDDGDLLTEVLKEYLLANEKRLSMLRDIKVRVVITEES